MARDGWLNPWKELSPTHRRELAAQRKIAADARLRLEGIVKAYRELIGDPRYEAIKAELEMSLGEQLYQLVEHAAGCQRCAPHALRVKVLNDVVARPLHQLWMEAQRSRLEPVELPSE